jgi:3-methyladenine DNA glycosylase AlkD
MTVDEILSHLRTLGSEKNRQGMARFGINVANACGVSMASLRPIAREHRRNRALARDLWETGVHEARILACLIEDPGRAGLKQLERWVQDLDSWDVTDQFCNKLVVKTSHAWSLASGWAVRPEEFVRRAGFSLMAQLAVHDRAALDRTFLPLLVLIEATAHDERNFVKKAVNWALRQIGKRNQNLRREAVASAQRLLPLESKSARWIARDALRELEKN